MSETKLYGILCANGSVSQRRFDIDEDQHELAPYDNEAVIEIVAVSADRLRALESLVRAADRMRKFVETIGMESISYDIKDAYDTQRAAVGEI